MSFATQELELRRQLGSHIALLLFSLLVDFLVGRPVLTIHQVGESHVKTALLVQESAGLGTNRARRPHSIL